MANIKVGMYQHGGLLRTAHLQRLNQMIILRLLKFCTIATSLFKLTIGSGSRQHRRNQYQLRFVLERLRTDCTYFAVK